MSMRRFHGPFVLALLAFSSFAYGCSSDDGGEGSANPNQSPAAEGPGGSSGGTIGALILDAPKDTHANAADDATLTAKIADGAKAIWLRDGKEIAGATSPSLTLSKAKLRDAGRYTIRVTDAGGRSEEASATLAVTGLEQIAGTLGGASFRDGPRLDARFAQPAGMARDPGGNLYVADRANHVIRKIAPDGTVSVFAGSPGEIGISNGKGTAARFNTPEGIAYAGDGTLVVADKGNYAIRKIALDGTVSTLAGMLGFSGATDGQGATAQFKSPSGIVALGTTLYVSDGCTVRKVDALTGSVSTAAGDKGSCGNLDGIPGSFQGVRSIALGPTGKLYVADSYHRLTQITLSTGFVTTLKVDGNDIQAPGSLAYDTTTDSLYVGYGGSSIRRLAGGKLTTVAGKDGEPGSADGAGGTARFWGIHSQLFDADGTLLVTDGDNGAIRRVAVNTPDVNVTTYAGKMRERAIVDGDGATARVASTSSLAVDAAGFAYAADDAAHVIRRIAPDGTTTTFAGKPYQPGLGDGALGQSTLWYTRALSYDPKGRLVFGDGCKLRFATMNGVVGSIGGQAGTCGGADSGILPNVYFQEIRSIVATADGALYVANGGRIQRITDNYVALLAGDSGQSIPKDGIGKSAVFGSLRAMVLGKDGALYAADGTSVRRISLTGEVTTIAGVPGVVGHVDGTGAQARFYSADTIALDSKTGDLFVGDGVRATIRRVTMSGSVSTIVGRPGWSSFQAGGLPAALVGPTALTALPDGRLLVGTDARLALVGL